MRVALYCRVSTEEQARHGLSLGEQMDSLREYAATQGHVVVGEYVDPGISARKRYAQRPGLLRLLDDAKAGKFDLVLFLKLDRWVRSVRDYYQVQDILDAAGVTWQATKEDYETVTASGRLKVNIMLSVAQDEADRTSERVKFIIEGRKKKGLRYNSRAPLGLKVVDGRLQKDEDTWDIALQMFETYVATRSAVSARNYIMEAGHPRAYNVVRRALKNESYKDFIPKDLWETAQKLLSSRSQRNAFRTDRTYLFSGLIRCGECGKIMSACRQVREKYGYTYTYIYYRCNSPYFEKEKCTHSKRIREDAIERYLLDNLSDLLDYYNFRVTQQAKKRKGPDKAQIKRKMDKLKDLYLSDLIDKETYAADYNALRSSLIEIEQEEKVVPLDTTAVRSAMTMYDDLTLAGKKAFWTRILDRIEVGHNGEISVFFSQNF